VSEGRVLVPRNAFFSVGIIDGDRERQSYDDSPGSTTDAKRVVRKGKRGRGAVFLNECEFRFNYRTPKQQLEPLKLGCYI
jgi:transposase-like protein